jgi:thioredoxin reductase (NADPH)
MFLDDRKSQVFPMLTPVQLQFALNFASGPARRFSPGEKVFNVGDRHAAVWLVVEGSLVATRHDGLGRESTFTTYGPGQFSREVSELGEQASLGAARAGPEGCVAYPFDAAPHLRALLIGSADIGEMMMMRAFILRRAAVLEDNGVGSVILGEAGSSDTVMTSS